MLGATTQRQKQSEGLHWNRRIPEGQIKAKYLGHRKNTELNTEAGRGSDRHVSVRGKWAHLIKAVLRSVSADTNTVAAYFSLYGHSPVEGSSAAIT